MSLKIVDIVKRFKGERGEDLEQWLERFETAVSITHAAKSTTEEEMLKLMPLFLEGAAYRTWKQLNATQKNDINEVRKALRRVYGISKAMAWQKLKTLHLFPGESVDVIADEARTLLTVITETTPSDQLVSLTVIDALPLDVAEQVRMQHGESMNSEKVISCAKALLVSKDMQSLTAATAQQNWTQRQSPPEPIHRTSRESRGPGPSSKVRCFGCQRAGHLQQSCSVICYRCGARGHIQRNCKIAVVPGNGRAGMVVADRAIPASESRSEPSPSMDGSEQC